MRSILRWNLGTRALELGKRTLTMGVVNVTPDSFSDGGLYLDCPKAVERAQRLLEEGADIIDIGGESTRPGAKVAVVTDATSSAVAALQSPSVTEEEELHRVIPVISELKRNSPAAIISVDTYKSAVARAAVDAGAEIVNDVSGFRWDPQMRQTLASLKCGAILMHMRGRPEQWRTLPPPADVVQLVKHELKAWSAAAIAAGVRPESIVLDPGFGFGKNLEENYPLLAHFEDLDELGFPLLAGVSRKSMIGQMLTSEGKAAPVEARLYGTLAAEVALILKGARIIRTHNVKAAAEAARIADIILETQ